MELKDVSLYIDTSIRGPRIRDGAYGYVLERKTAAGPATLTDVCKISASTEHRSLLMALIAALGHIRQPCRLTVYTECGYMADVLTKWLQVWEKNEWKRSRDKPLKNADEWKKAAALQAAHEVDVKLGVEHEYKIYLRREVDSVADGKAFTPL